MTARPAPAWLTQWEFAHRGLHGPGVPENSLAAAEGAIARGMGIECDIQRSRDDHPMVFHDWELERLTGEAGATGDMSAEALEQLRLLGTDQHPVKLARFLEVVAGRAPLLIEIKSLPGYEVEWTCASVAWLLDSYEGAAAVMSFDPRVPEWFAAEAPGICRGLVGTDSYENGFEGVWRDPAALAAAQPDFLAIDVRDLARPEAAAWRAGGRPLLTWTVRSPGTRAIGLAHADALIAEGEGLA
ncbi:glycerophosphodiester phosphodiesterase family protein [Erythrobacter sp. WG]|uniref:glycerophosphodiester phosphodiesterase family protein n=1 Tax=Erythrobacter sp. WG TaxID=2985510 RepID=UPI002271AF71|nr:glycerophosphodiester phosphodiesterase family protein [Erythrobacter sp. WG]MCX9145867.1 glycerophosphodiester phosphodiesterase family protein [Erythrobacter sp. WG]